MQENNYLPWHLGRGFPSDEVQHESDAEARQVRGFDGLPQQSTGRTARGMARGAGLVARQQTVASDEKWRNMRRRRAFKLPQPSTFRSPSTQHQFRIRGRLCRPHGQLAASAVKLIHQAVSRSTFRGTWLLLCRTRVRNNSHEFP